jgi:hypothetical protein
MLQVPVRFLAIALSVLALLTFFVPIIVVHIPIVGEKQFSGYDAITRANQLRHTLLRGNDTDQDKARIGSGAADDKESQPPVREMSSSSSRRDPDFPASLQLSWMIPLMIGCSYLAATGALIGLALRASQLANFASMAGTITSLAAVIHVHVLNSDMQSWLGNSLTGSSDLKDNPFAGLANAIIGAFQINPGWGLYGLCILFGCVAVLSFRTEESSQVLPAADDLVERRPHSASSVAESKRVPAILGLAIVIVVVSIGVDVFFGHSESSTPAQVVKHALNEQGQPGDVASKPSIAFTGNFTVPAAFAALFGNYDPSTQSSLVPVIGRYEAANQTGKVTLLLDSSLSEGGVQKHLLVTSTTVDDEQAHVDGARIGAYVFADRGSRWIAEIADKEITQFGAFGHAFGLGDDKHPNGDQGEAQAVRFGPNVYGFSLTSEDSHQGIAYTTETFVAPVEGRYQPVLSVGLAYSSEGDCGPSGSFQSTCDESTSTVRFLNSVHAGFFDIEVDEVNRLRGGVEVSQAGQYSVSQMTPASQKKLYIFSGGKYVE